MGIRTVVGVIVLLVGMPLGCAYGPSTTGGDEQLDSIQSNEPIAGAMPAIVYHVDGEYTEDPVVHIRRGAVTVIVWEDGYCISVLNDARNNLQFRESTSQEQMRNKAYFEHLKFIAQCVGDKPFSTWDSPQRPDPILESITVIDPSGIPQSRSIVVHKNKWVYGDDEAEAKKFAETMICFSSIKYHLGVIVPLDNKKRLTSAPAELVSRIGHEDLQHLCYHGWSPRSFKGN